MACQLNSGAGKSLFYFIFFYTNWCPLSFPANGRQSAVDRWSTRTRSLREDSTRNVDSYRDASQLFNTSGGLDLIMDFFFHTICENACVCMHVCMGVWCLIFYKLNSILLMINNCDIRGFFLVFLFSSNYTNKKNFFQKLFIYFVITFHALFNKKVFFPPKSYASTFYRLFTRASKISSLY